MTYLFYSLALSGLSISFLKDKNKTKTVITKSWKSFIKLLPDFLGIMALIALLLSIITPAHISNLIGTTSGFNGSLLATVLGSLALIPSFISFPLVTILLKNGAGYSQITAFLATLTMVGLISIPLEIRVFNKKATILRNILAFIFALVSAIIVGGIYQ